MIFKHIIFDCDGTLVKSEKNKYVLFREIKELLLELKKDDLELSVWTGRDRFSTLNILKELKVISYFKDFRCCDDTIPKPHPMGIKDLADGFKPSEILIIGDSISDIKGAKSFGCLSIGALWNSKEVRPSLEDAGANFLADKPLDCLNFIREKKDHV